MLDPDKTLEVPCQVQVQIYSMKMDLGLDPSWVQTLMLCRSLSRVEQVCPNLTNAKPESNKVILVR